MRSTGSRQKRKMNKNFENDHSQQNGMKRKYEDYQSQKGESQSRDKRICLCRTIENSEDQDAFVLERKYDDREILHKSDDEDVFRLQNKSDNENVLENSDHMDVIAVQKILADRGFLRQSEDDEVLILKQKSDDDEVLILKNESKDKEVLEKLPYDDGILFLERSDNPEVVKLSNDPEDGQLSVDPEVVQLSGDPESEPQSDDEEVSILKKKSEDKNFVKKPNDKEIAEKTSAMIQKYGCPRSSKNEYEILEFLGEGTFGEVAKCLKKKDKEVVALKICKHTDMARFSRERLILNRINNENPDEFNLVRNLENFIYEKHFFMVFGLLDKSLSDFIDENDFRLFPIEAIRYITQQLLVALGKLRDLRIIHGDLKPENIMFVNHKREPYRIKLIDFGLSIQLPTERYPMNLGTLTYRAPEVILGKKYCESADMWSMGCIVAEILVGAILYPGEIPYDQIRFVDEVQGPFPNHMLHANKVAAQYFCNETSEDGEQCKWRIKNPEEYSNDTGKTPIDARRYRLKSLNSLHRLCSTVRRMYDDEDVTDTKYCIIMLKKMLELDPEDRISPDDALECDFIRYEERFSWIK